MTYSKHFILMIAAASLVTAQVRRAVPASEDNVVAVVDGREFKKSDVEALLYIAPPAFQQYYQSEPKEALGQYMMLMHIAEEGRARGIDQRAPLKEQIQWQVNEMIVRAMASEIENTYPVPTEKIDEYYKTHPGSFGETTVKGIVIQFQRTAQGTSTQDLQVIAEGLFSNKRSERDAREMADDILLQLREGADFDKLIEKYSEDPDSKAKGGVMPPVRSDSALPADYLQAVAALEVGKISAPLRQPGAFYIVRVEGRTLRPIEQVRGEIVMAIRRDHRVAWFNDINSRYRVQVKDESFFQPKAPAGLPALPGQPGQR